MYIVYGVALCNEMARVVIIHGLALAEKQPSVTRVYPMLRRTWHTANEITLILRAIRRFVRIELLILPSQLR